ncbi:MAG: TIGR01244 family sulfur transferase [Halopseudomonas sp.]
MDISKISPAFSVAGQLSLKELGLASAQGYKTIINNRPDGESDDQPTSAEFAQTAKELGLEYRYVPVVSGQITDDNVVDFKAVLDDVMGPVLAFCRTGSRSTTLWALSQAQGLSAEAIVAATEAAGYNLTSLIPRLNALASSDKGDSSNNSMIFARHSVVIVGGGAGGISTAASLLKRDPNLDVAIIEPSESHYYQPGWTLVGGGVFNRAQTKRAMVDVLPKQVSWIRAAVSKFNPDSNEVTLENGERVSYKVLVAAPGIKLDWGQVEGLEQTLGRNGVTSNYKFDMAPYTWELIQDLRGGKALFTQPPIPIKCAGAPQKAMYLACSYWLKKHDLKNIDVQFHNAGGVLFGVADYIPALMEYVNKYRIKLCFNEKLIKVDGGKRIAYFEVTTEEGSKKIEQQSFDMLHVCPNQTAPDFVRNSPLANNEGWIDVSPETLQHNKFGNIFALGDATSTPNAKTAAAVRLQAPVVAVNTLLALQGKAPRAVYNGYGSCPLTVERGKIVLAEFGYGGKLLPSFPKFMVNGLKASRRAWFLKEKILPTIYFDYMLKAREWLAKPEMLQHTPTDYEARTFDSSTKK